MSTTNRLDRFIATHQKSQELWERSLKVTRGIEGCVFNTSSVLHLHFGRCQKCDRTICLDATKSMPPEVINALNWHLLLNGVNLLRGVVGWVSAVHTKEDVDQTIEAFGSTLDGMLAEGVI